MLFRAYEQTGFLRLWWCRLESRAFIFVGFFIQHLSACLFLVGFASMNAFKGFATRRRHSSFADGLVFYEMMNARRRRQLAKMPGARRHRIVAAHSSLH